MTTRLSRVSALADAARRFWRDLGGVAAVEFGLIAPILMVMLVGAIEATRAVQLDKRISLATSMVADLVAREQSLTKEDVNKIYEIVEEAMAPFGTADLGISLVPVMSAPNDATKTLVYPSTESRPSYGNGPVFGRCQSYSLAPGMLKANESVIVVEARYAYKPLFLSYGDSSFVSNTWIKRAYAKPRKSLCVAFDGANCTSTCFSS